MVLPEVEKRRSGVADVPGITSTRQARRESHGKIFTPWYLSQVTCGDHVKWITDEKSRKDRSVSKGETMSIEKD